MKHFPECLSAARVCLTIAIGQNSAANSVCAAGFYEAKAQKYLVYNSYVRTNDCKQPRKVNTTFEREDVLQK